MTQTKRQTAKKKNKKKVQSAITGFSTLNQVAGVPKPSEHHSSIPVDTPKRIREPQPVCSYCGKEIENIASAFMAPDGTYAHFDCVLERIRETEKPGEGESVSYIGGGCFGIIGRGEDGKPIIIRRIQYESPETVRSMKAYVASLRD